MIEGSCQCGSVTWRFEGVPETATTCNCSICRRYGALWAYDFENEKIKVSGATQVYKWNRKWIEFHHCPTCGCIAYWRAAMIPNDGRRRIAVNLRLAAPEAVGAVKAIALIHHDTESRSDFPADGMHVADVWA